MGRRRPVWAVYVYANFLTVKLMNMLVNFTIYLEEEKREAHQKMNRLLGDGGIIDKDMLRIGW